MCLVQHIHCLEQLYVTRYFWVTRIVDMSLMRAFQWTCFDYQSKHDKFTTEIEPLPYLDVV